MATRWTLGGDANEPHRLAAFWAAALGYVAEPGFESADAASIIDPDGVGPVIGWLRKPEAKVAKNRFHIDIRVAGDGPWDMAERERMIRSRVPVLVDLGATAARRTLRIVAVKRTRAARAARKRKRRMDSVEHDLSTEQWTALQEAWGGCAYCGASDRPLQRDCVLPISRGGRYTVENVVPACGSCNASKCNDEVTGWLRRKKLDERAFLVRHYEIVSTLGQS